jgi:hypothetical protein
MHEKDSPFPIADSQGRLECKELWGGIQNEDIEVSAGKIIVSIYSASSEGGAGWRHLLFWGLQRRHDFTAGDRRCYRSRRNCLGDKPVRL